MEIKGLSWVEKSASSALANCSFFSLSIDELKKASSISIPSGMSSAMVNINNTFLSLFAAVIYVDCPDTRNQSDS